MTKEQILLTVKENMKGTYGTSKYDSLEKLKNCGYYVECVKDEINSVAFDNNYDLTIEEEKELLEKFFN